MLFRSWGVDLHGQCVIISYCIQSLICSICTPIAFWHNCYSSRYSLLSHLPIQISVIVNFKYDPESQQLVITLDDGTAQNVDLSALITQYEFLEGDEIAFEVTSDGKVKPMIKGGSITEDKLQPNFLADIKVESAKAVASAKSAKESETKAATSATDAKDSADRAQEIENEINKKLTMTEFDVNEDGELIYMDNAAYNFILYRVGGCWG